MTDTIEVVIKAIDAVRSPSIRQVAIAAIEAYKETDEYKKVIIAAYDSAALIGEGGVILYRDKIVKALKEIGES